MDQNQSTSRISLKELLFSLLLTFAVFSLLSAALSFLFLQLDQHERFYSIAPWTIVVLLSAWITFLAKKSRSNSVLFAFLISTVVSVICLATGLILKSTSGGLILLLARFATIIFFSVLFTVVFNYVSSKRQKSSLNRKAFKKR